LEKDIGFLIKLIHDTVEKTANKELKKAGLTIAQFRVIVFFKEKATDKISQKELEDYFGVSHPTMVGIIKRMEKKGFVISKFDSEDGRIKNIYITPKGKSAYEEINFLKNKNEKKLISDIKNDEVKKLRELLTKMYENIK